MNFINKIKRILQINRNVIKAEAQELSQLNITREDEEQALKLSVLAVAGLAACGIPCGPAGQQVIARVLAYAIRDLKDGIEINDKLIINRVINEIKAEKQSGQ